MLDIGKRKGHTFQEIDEDINLYKSLFHNYHKKIYKIAFYILKSEYDAEDVVQEAFIIAFEKLNTLRDITKFEPWICKIASNIAKRKCDKRKREVLYDNHDNVITFVNPELEFYIPEKVAENREFKTFFKEQLNNLKSHYKEVIFLYFYLELSYKEISEVLDLNIGTVKSRLNRGKQVLMENILESTYFNNNLKMGD